MTALVTYCALFEPPDAVQSPESPPLPQAAKLSGIRETRLMMVRFMFLPLASGWEGQVITDLRVWTPAFRLQKPLMGSDGFSWSGSLDETDIQSLYAACQSLRFSG